MNKKQERFTEKDIPYDLLEKIGIKKMDVLGFDKKNIQALLSGNRTNLQTIKGIDSKGEPFELKGKISLYRRTADNKVSINIHPVRKDMKNDIGLKGDEIDKVKKGLLIQKTINGEKHLVQLDQETNELLRVKLKNILIPSHIKDVELSSIQKEKLRKGQPITIKSGKDKLQVGIDLNSPIKLSVSKAEFERKKKWDYDYHNPNVVSTIQTDRNKSEFIEYSKKNNNKRGI